MFDAGAIEASLTVRLDQFNRDMDAAEKRVRAFESEKHQVKISAVFDTASMTRARKMFADLDMQISRDAAQRLRTSPQGSVLGSLNALFSPHPVTGSPSAQQSGQQGLLGKMFNTPGAGGGIGGPAPGPQQRQQQQDQPNRSLLQRLFSSVFSGRGGGSTGGSGGAGGFGSGLAGGIGPGILGIGAKASGIIGLGGSLLGALPATFAGLGALGVGGAGIGAAGLLFSGVQKQISPLNQAFSQAQQAQAAATTPQQAQAAAQQMQSVMQQVNQLNPAMRSIFNSEQQIQNTWQSFTSSFAPLFAGALSSVAQLFQRLQPTLQGFFGNATKLVQPFIQGLGDVATQVLPLLGQAFAAVGPLMRPMLDGLGQAVAGLLPGLISLLKGAQPAVNTLFGGLAIIGRGLGQMFTAFAPVVKDSATILNALLSVLSALFPVVGQLAAIFASALAPVFSAFAATIKSLLPFLTIVGKVLASLAGAILGDLVSAFTALAQLLTDISPGLKVFADVLSQAFNLLENSGVFAILGNALEAIVTPLGALINLLLKQLAPLLPVIINLASQFADILVTLLAAGLTTVLQGITWLLTKLPWLVPLIAAVTAGVWLFNAALAANPIGLVVIAIVGLIGAITLLVTHWHRVWSDIKQWAEDAWNFIWNGFGKFLLPLLGPVGAIALGAIELSKHWQQIWGDIKNWFFDAVHGIEAAAGAFGRFFTDTVPRWFDDAVGGIEKAWNAVYNTIVAPIKHAYDDVMGLVNTMIGGIENLLGIANKSAGQVGSDLSSMAGTLAKSMGGPPHPGGRAGFATGGRIKSGTGPTADDVLIRASRGETVVSAALSTTLAPLFAALGVPGYENVVTASGTRPLASYGTAQRGDRLDRAVEALERAVALLGRERPIIGEYTTAFYDTGNTVSAMRELSRTLRIGQLQAVVPGS